MINLRRVFEGIKNLLITIAATIPHSIANLQEFKLQIINNKVEFELFISQTKIRNKISMFFFTEVDYLV